MRRVLFLTFLLCVIALSVNAQCVIQWDPLSGKLFCAKNNGGAAWSDNGSTISTIENVAIGTRVLDPATSEPACDSSRRGHEVRVNGGGGVADTLRVCMKAAGGTYSWVSMSGGSGGATIASTSGMLKGDGAGNGVAATAGTDYAAPTSGSTALKGNGAGGFSSATQADVGAGLIAAGSTLSIPQWAEILAGVCQSSTASVAFSLPTSNAPTAACKTGSNVQMGVATFTATSQTAQGSFVLPDDWISVLAVEFRFASATAAATGNAVWNFTYACVASSGGSEDPSFAAAQTASVAAVTNNTTNTATLTTPTISGCSGGQRMFYKIGLDGTTTAAGNQDLIALRIKLKRTVTAL